MMRSTTVGREESAGALDAILRIAGETDDRVVDALGTEISALWRAGMMIGFGQDRSWIHAAKMVVSSVWYS